MHEREIFKHIEKFPKYLTCPEIPRILTKVWSAYTKLIRTLLSSYKSAIAPELGKFIPTPKGAQFIPNSSFLFLFNYSSNSFPSSSSVPEQLISYSSISLATSYPKEACVNSIKEILSAAALLSKSSPVTLDMKIGHLQFRALDFKFTSGYKPISVVETGETANLANPNDIGQFDNLSKRIKSVPPNPANIPWPYFPGFYEESAKKLGKKFNFEEQLSPAQLLEEHRKQIEVKKFKSAVRSKEEKKEGQIFVCLANQRLTKERNLRANKEKVLQEIFFDGNKTQIETHRAQNEEKKVAKLSEKYDFFPFVYGSKLEEYQQKLKDQLKKEMKLKMENDNKEFKGKQGITEEYITSFPVFLKQDKYVPSRRVEDTHVKVVMGQALNRYEQELNALKAQKIQEEQMELAKELAGKLYEEQGKMSLEQNLTQNRDFIMQQMEDNVRNKQKIKKNQEQALKFKPTKNHFGPEESPERIQKEREKVNQQKQEIKEELVQQMIKKRKEIEERRLKEMRNEEANALALVREWEKDEIKKEIKDRAAKNLNREAWIRQMEMKALEKSVNN